MESDAKLYVVTRRDLTPEQQAVQSCHAAIEFQAACALVAVEWRSRSNTLAMLTVATERDLEMLIGRAFMRSIAVATFREPDLGDALTAIAIGPAGAALCRKLPLLHFSSTALASSPAHG
jgi:hypothetical protein